MSNTNEKASTSAPQTITTAELIEQWYGTIDGPHGPVKAPPPEQKPGKSDYRVAVDDFYKTVDVPQAVPQED
jgi:hypothetical protein